MSALTAGYTGNIDEAVPRVTSYMARDENRLEVVLKCLVTAHLKGKEKPREK